MMSRTIRPTPLLAVALLSMLAAPGPRARADEPPRVLLRGRLRRPRGRSARIHVRGCFDAIPCRCGPRIDVGPAAVAPADLARTAQTVALFAAVSLAPVAVLMATAFVRINIVLLLLRQALGSPQVPGNQVLTALARCC